MTVVCICWLKLLKLTDGLRYGGVCLLWGTKWRMFSFARRISVFKMLRLLPRFIYLFFWRSVTCCVCRAILHSLVLKYDVTDTTSFFSIYLSPLAPVHIFNISRIHIHFSFPALVSRAHVLAQLIKHLNRKKRLCSFSTSHSLVLQFRKQPY
jgi:hypothetical protein